LGGSNIHVAEDGTWTVIDFDLCGAGCRAYDLATIRQVALYQKKNTTWDLFLRGYLSTRPISDKDMAAVPLFHAIGRLWSIGVCAEKAADWGTLSLADGRFDYELAFFREWEAEHKA
jgi:Ser/Thr protein kinase RdoA (MazF antagonist)